LKRGEPNHEEFQKRDARFISEATTVEKWPLIVASNLNMPFLLNQKGLGKVHLNSKLNSNFQKGCIF